MGKDANVYIFRVNYEQYYNKILDELKKGRLRQGWGASGMDINEAYSLDDYIHGWENAWGLPDRNLNYVKNKYNNLKIMLEMKKGDLIIIPKVYDYNSFTIVTVGGEYYFDKSEDVFKDGSNVDDFRHVIPIDLEKSFKSISYHSCHESEIIKAKFRAYQYPVNRVYNKDVIESVNKILSTDMENLSEDKRYLDILDIKNMDPYKSVLEEMLEKIRSWSPDSLEKIIEELFESNGYVLERRNSYDRKGGDIDLTFKCPVGGIVENIASIANQETKLYLPKINIQLKKKYNIDINDIEGVNQLINMSNDEENSINILMSTADDFTTECKQKAEGNGVVLVNGNNLAKLILKYGNIEF